MKLIDYINALVKRALDLQTGSHHVSDFVGWQREVASMLDEVFGSASPEIYEFAVRIQPILEQRHCPPSDFRDAMRTHLGRAVEFLDDIAIKLRDGTTASAKKTACDFGIVCPMTDERAALLSMLPPARIVNRASDIRTYYQTSVRTVGGAPHKLVIVQPIQTGNVDAASAIQDLIKAWLPRYVVVLGIAGGVPRSELSLGDVVVADCLIEYEHAKELRDLTERRPRYHRTNALVLDRVRALEGWQGPVPRPRPPASRKTPRVFVGPIATGEKVVASTDARDRLRSLHPLLLAVETESAGVASIVWQNPEPPGLVVIRGISDMADEKKDDRWRMYAASAAASFLLSLLTEGRIEPTLSPRDRRDSGRFQ
jgi:nucleoside phosphorylase